MLGIAAGLVCVSAGLSTAAPLVVRDFQFLGFDKDVVGPTDARPNGERDAHFSFVVASPGGAQSIRGLALWFCSPRECGDAVTKSGASFAATSSLVNPPPRRTGPWRLGVVLAGRSLAIDARRQATWLRLPRSANGVRLDLYVNDGPGCVQGPKAPAARSCAARHVTDHRFGPGLHFRVQVVSGAARAYSPWLALPGARQKPRPAVALGSFRFLGLDKDVAGSTLGSAPDGKPDAHFGLDFAASNGPGYLWGAGLARAEPGQVGGGWTTTTKHEGSALTVFLDGKRLDLGGSPDGSHAESWVDLHWSSTTHHLDLYAYNFGSDWNPPVDQFAPGSRFKVMLLVIVPQYVPGETAGGAETSLTVPGG